MKNLKLTTLLLALTLCTLLMGQTTKEQFYKERVHAAGVYQPYLFNSSPQTAPPKGYKPFYLSHYGRHGSRWIHTPESYNYLERIFREAHTRGALTPLGEECYRGVILAADDARGRYGHLTPLGVEEHRAIAERLFYSFPEIFNPKEGGDPLISSRSTVVPRCILSMAANNERLKELNPKLKIERESAERFRYLNNSYRNRWSDSTYAIRDNFIKERIDLELFIAKLFKDRESAEELIESPVNFIRVLHLLAIDLTNTPHLELSLLELFSNQELFILWQAFNMVMYYNCGPSPLNGKVAMDSSKLLLANIIESAESSINGGEYAAHLRFGHDSYIIPLLALMGVEGMDREESDPAKIYRVWSDFIVSPMAVNLQIIFYRADKGGPILVKFLHCEREVKLAIPTDNFPYYSWDEVKKYLLERINS